MTPLALSKLVLAVELPFLYFKKLIIIDPISTNIQQDFFYIATLLHKFDQRENY